MEMDSSRRSFDRSREQQQQPGMKKQRLSDEPNLRDPRIRGSLPQRAAAVAAPPPPTSTAPSRYRQSERDIDSNDSGGYQPTHQLFSELVNQYRTALAELTINSKPIITNLTIIAGENLHAAKAIAATICDHIIEVPSEQKLPSLYLLDSIVKNIGRDYIKYFSTRLPEVFCKAYKQVDPSVHTGMRHLFRTWEGVFPLQPLQMIEKELSISLAVNGLGSVSARSKPESQSQYPQQSIHVNPKYLEARQNVQQPSRAKGMTTDISANGMKPSVTAARLNMQRRETSRDSVYEKDTEGQFDDYDYALKRSGIVEHDKSWYRTGSIEADTDMEQHNGYDGRHKLSNYLTTQTHASRNNGGMSKSWKNAEEEEYLWDDIDSRVINRSAPSDHRKDNMVFDDSDMEYTDGMNYRTAATLHSRQASDYAGVLGVTSSSMERKGLPTQVMRHSSTGAMTKTLSNNVGQKRPAPTSRQSGIHQRSPSPSFSAGPDSSPMDTLAELDLPVSQSIQRPVAKAAQLAEQANIRHRGQLKRELSPGLLQSNKKQLPECQKSRLVSSSVPASQQRVQQRSLPPHSRPDGKQSELSIQNLKPPIPELSTPGASAVEAVKQLSSSGLLAAVLNSGVLPTCVNNPKPELDPKDLQHMVHSRVQPPLSGGTARRQLAAKSPKITAASLTTQSQGTKPVMPDSKKADASPLTNQGKAQSKKPEEVKTPAANPFSSLLSTLMEKGLITTSKNESQTTPPLPDGAKDANTGDISRSLPASGIPALSSLPSLFGKDEVSVSEQAPLYSVANPSSAPEIKNLIGFEFKPNIIRKFHEPVIEELIDGLPYRCDICGLRLKFQERLEKHMDWHSAKEHDTTYGVSRKWFSNLDHWVGERLGNTIDITAENEEASIEDEQCMVLADESQCVCVLCGEIFDDYYSQEKDEWMFKGAVHVKVECPEVTETMNVGPASDLITVHADCYTESSACELGLVAKVKVEEDPYVEPSRIMPGFS